MLNKKVKFPYAVVIGKMEPYHYCKNICNQFYKDDIELRVPYEKVEVSVHKFYKCFHYLVKGYDILVT